MFNIFRKKYETKDINTAGQELAENPNILLLDVRTPAEYNAGHLPGSINLPLDAIEGIAQKYPDRDRRIFAYCQSGARSGAACNILAKLAYTDVTNIGGIMAWQGKITTK
ncbi:rhodanese-like domain-containing protein [Ruminococcaceae bacterium OttesenSCG-928-A16]|nr:rhodanese-like domain-containing protein [Ruminococcaceae bacterium OttesenSCG-928-A16]